MKKVLTILIFITGICSCIFSQNNLCSNAHIFCSGTTYNIPSNVNYPNAEIGPDYGCLVSQPNPIWYYFSIEQPGEIILKITTLPHSDIDFICWGPFNYIEYIDICNNLTSDKIIDCEYSPAYEGWCNIPNAQTEQYYMLMITNFSNQNTNIVLEQDSIIIPSSGSTLCCWSACCFNYMTTSIDSCYSQSNKFSISGDLYFELWGGAISTGQLNIVDQPSGISQVINAPIHDSLSPFNYHLDNIPVDGLQHTLTAVFTDAPNCTYSLNYQAPDSCNFTSIKTNEIFSLNSLNVFPNPVINGYFNINYFSKSVDKLLIKIINTKGIEVYGNFISKNTESIEMQFDTDGLINGYYIVEINDGQKIIRKSLVVQNIY